MRNTNWVLFSVLNEQKGYSKDQTKHRGINQLRHTFASQLITSGEISLDWIAQQMGTSIMMLNKHYGKIIETDRKRKGKEISKILGVENKSA